MSQHPPAPDRPTAEFLTRHHLPADTTPSEMAGWARYERIYPDAFDLHAGEDLYAERD